MMHGIHFSKMCHFGKGIVTDIKVVAGIQWTCAVAGKGWVSHLLLCGMTCDMFLHALMFTKDVQEEP